MGNTYLNWFLLSCLQCCSAEERPFSVIPLAEYLKHEVCNLYFLPTSTGHEPHIASLLRQPIYIVDLNGLLGLRTLRFGCRALVYENNGGFPLKNLKVASIFQRMYVLSIDGQSSWYNELDFRGTSFEYSLRKSGEIAVKVHCQYSEHWQAVNIWKPDIGFIYKLDNAKEQCGNVLKDKHLKVAATNLSPYVLNSKNEMRGVEKMVLDIIARKMLFTYDVSIDEESGAKINGSWTGVVGRVVNGEMEIGIGGLLLFQDRNSAVDFSSPLYPANMHFMATKPKIVSSNMNFLNPFESQVWWMILAVLTVATISFTGMGHAKVGKFNGKQDLWGSLFVCLRILLHDAGIVFKHRSHGALVIFGFCCVFAFFISAMYTSNFRASLMETEYERPVDTEEDIVELKKKLYVPANSVVSKLLSTSPISIQRELFELSNNKENYFHWQNGKIPKYFMDKMILEGGAIVSVKELLYNSFPYYNLTYGYIPFKVGNKAIFQFYSGFVVQKKTSWRPDMDKIILRLIEAGIILHLKENAVPNRYLREEPQDTSPKPFAAEQTSNIFFILSGGLITSVLGFLLEIILRPVHHIHDGISTGDMLQITIRM